MFLRLQYVIFQRHRDGTHSSFYKLGMHPDNERAYLEEKLTLYRQVLMAQEDTEDSEGGMKKRTIKQMMKKIAPEITTPIVLGGGPFIIISQQHIRLS